MKLHNDDDHIIEVSAYGHRYRFWNGFLVGVIGTIFTCLLLGLYA